MQLNDVVPGPIHLHSQKYGTALCRIHPLAEVQKRSYTRRLRWALFGHRHKKSPFSNGRILARFEPVPVPRVELRSAPLRSYCAPSLSGAMLICAVPKPQPDSLLLFLSFNFGKFNYHHMGSELNSPSSSSSPSGKRSRDPEDEVYVDNLHSHKRYLSEIMASSLNGLTVGDPLHENLMESPARSETMFYLRDDMSLQYSPMSEDSDDHRYCETSINTSSSQTDSLPTSPVSPHRYQRPLSALSSSSGTTACPSHGCTLAAVTCAQPRQRGSDSEGRFPSSPSDICHSADLRRAALLRSVQMRAQPPGPSAFELPFGAGQEAVPNMEAEGRPCLVDERDYQIEECSSMSISEHEFNREKSCRVLNMNLKGEEPGD